WQISANLGPRVAGVVAAHDVPVLLHEEYARVRRMHGDVVNAVADLRRGIGDMFGTQSLIDGLPGLSAVVGAEGARGRDGDEYPLRIAGVQNDGVQAHAPRAGLPSRTGAVAA